MDGEEFGYFLARQGRVGTENRDLKLRVLLSGISPDHLTP